MPSLFGGGGGGGGGSPIFVPSPQPYVAPGPKPADMAASGALRPELLGATTPGFKGGLSGDPAAPQPGLGSAITGPIGGADRSGGGIGTQADSFTEAIQSALRSMGG